MRKLLSTLLCIMMVVCFMPTMAFADEGTGGDVHEHVFTKRVQAEQYLKSENQCAGKAYYYYSCECGEKDTSVFSVSTTPLGHQVDENDNYCERCNTTFDAMFLNSDGVCAQLDKLPIQITKSGKIILFDDITMTGLTIGGTLYHNVNLDVNLNGHTITFTSNSNGGSVMFNNQTKNCIATFRNGTITGSEGLTGNLIYVKGKTNNKLVLAEDLDVQCPSTIAYGIFVNGDGQLTTSADITTSGSAIATNGYTTMPEAKIVVNGGNIQADGLGVYLPVGNLELNGGTITGDTAVEVKGGNVSIPTGSTVNLQATGTPSHVANGSGASTSGYALAIVENNGYAKPSVNVQGGTFNGTVDVVTDNEVAEGNKAELQISGGQLGLEQQIANATAGSTIKLLGNHVVPNRIIVDKDLTIDLNGNTLRNDNGPVFWVKGADVTITGEGTIVSDNPGSSSAVIWSGLGTKTTNLTIGKDVEITGTTDYGVSVYGSDADHSNLIVNCNIKILGEGAALSGNGSFNNASITVNDDASLECTNGLGIYFPQAGTLTLNGGTIKGLTAVEMKSGDLVVPTNSPVKLIATGQLSHNVPVDGPSTSGYALALVENAGYAGGITTAIAGGQFTGSVDVVADNQVPTDKKAEITVTGGDLTDIAKLIDNAPAGSTVKVLADQTVTNRIKITKDITIDLNGHTLRNDNGPVLWVCGADVELTGQGTIVSDNTAEDYSVIWSGYGQSNTKLTIGKDVLITGKADYGVSVYGTAADSAQLIINGKVITTGNGAAVSGNGSNSPASILINDGAVLECTNGLGIYFPQEGTLKLNGGTIKGLTAIEMKAGNLVIPADSQAKLIATGQVSHNVPVDGPSTTGYALALVENAGYAGGITTAIAGGQFTGPVEVVADNQVPEDKKAQLEITGGELVDINSIIEKAPAGSTIRVLQDQTLTQTIEIDKDITIDLNGHTLRNNNGPVLFVNGANVAITGEGTIVSDNPGSNDSVLVVGPHWWLNSNLIIGKDVTVTGSTDYGVSAFGFVASQGNVIVNGTIDISGTGACLSGNGSYNNASFTVNEGAKLECLSGLGIYFPQKGTLTLNGGTIKGLTAVEMKSGDLVIPTGSQAQLIATGVVNHIVPADGPSTSGYALALVENSGYAGGITTAIAGGQFSGLVNVLADDEVAESKKAELTVTGGDLADLSKLIENAEVGSTVKVLADQTVTNRIKITKDITIDLNGHTLRNDNGPVLWVCGADVELTGQGTIVSDNTAEDYSVIWSGYGQSNTKLTIGKDVLITGKADYGVSVYGTAADSAQLIINGKVITTGNGAAVSGNGSNSPASIEINDGAVVECTNGLGIYFPQEGTLTINGGMIQGSTAVEMKAGTLNIAKGCKAQLIATGEVKQKAPIDGPSTSGFALAVVEKAGYVGATKVVLEGGHFQGLVEVLIDSQVEDSKKASLVIKGGIYSSNPNDYVEEGLKGFDTGYGFAILKDYDKQIEDLTNDNASKQEAIENLNQQVAQLQETIDNNQTKIDQLTQANEANEATIATLRNDITRLETDVASKQQTIDNLNQQITNLQTLNSANTLQIAQLTQANNQLENEVEQLQNNLTNVQADVTAKQQVIDGLNQNITNLTAQVAGLENDITSKQGTIDSLNNRITDLTAQVANLQSTIDSKDVTIGDLNTSLTALRNQVAVLEASVATKDTTIGTLNNSIAQLTNQVESLEASVAAKDTTIAGLNNNITELTNKVASLEASVASKDVTIGTLNTRITDLTTQVANLQSTIDSKDVTIGDLNTSLTALRNQVTSLEETIATKDSNIATLNDTVTQLRNQVESLEASVAAKDLSIDSLTAQVTLLTGNVESLTSEIATKESDIARLNGLVATLETANKDNQTQINNLNTSFEEYKAQQAELLKVKDGWKSNSTIHWQENGYGNMVNAAVHTTSEWIIDTPATAITAGQMHKVCSVCGATVLNETIANIADVKLNATKFIYTGKVITPTVTIVDVNGNQLVSGVDYQVTYPQGSKLVGTYKVLVTFQGKYNGTSELLYKVVPKVPTIKTLTPGIKKLTVKTTVKPSAVGGTSYKIGYKVKGTSTWKYVTTTSTTKTISKLKTGKTYIVKVKAIKTVNGVKYESGWSKTKTSTKIK